MFGISLAVHIVGFGIPIALMTAGGPDRALDGRCSRDRFS
jgi:hypothetical protein